MKKFNLLTAVILGIVLIYSVDNFGQDKKENCCSDSTMCKMKYMDHSKMDHSKMNHSMVDSTETNHSKMDHSMMKEKMGMGEMKAKEVDVKMVAWNAVCPVRGEKIDPEANKVEYNGKVYGFCCNGCDSKFIKDPEKYSKNLSNDGTEFIEKK
jgi:YHS domain-containing protein